MTCATCHYRVHRQGLPTEPYLTLTCLSSIPCTYTPSCTEYSMAEGNLIVVAAAHLPLMPWLQGPGNLRLLSSSFTRAFRTFSAAAVHLMMPSADAANLRGNFMSSVYCLRRMPAYLMSLKCWLQSPGVQTNSSDQPVRQTTTRASALHRMFPHPFLGECT